ncbi:MAG: hypothetical protein P8X66_07190 [Maritimibacter sp.]
MRTGIDDLAERRLNARFVIQPEAVHHFKNEMGASIDLAIAANEVIVAGIVENVTGNNVIGGAKPTTIGVFLMGACFQTDPQLKEVGVLHGAPLCSSRFRVVSHPRIQSVP